MAADGTGRDPAGGRGRRAIRRQLLLLAWAAGGALVFLSLARGEYDLFACALVLAALAAGSALRPVRRDDPGRPTPPAGEAESGNVLAAMPDPAILLDRRANVVDANAPAFAALPGLRLRHPLAFALRAPQVLDAVQAALGAGQPGEVEHGGRAPTEPTFAIRVRPLAGGGPSDAAVALFFHDLTAERRTETLRVDFIANVSHELRTPLASLIGFIETLQGPARDDAAARARFLEIMRGQAARMSRLIDDLLRLSRVELRAHQPPSTPVDLTLTVGHMVELMTPLARERGVVLASTLPDAPVTVPGDRDELLRIVENLVENAVKYGGRGGTVEVSLNRRPEGGWAELAVRDHGPGIAPEHLPRLTERFYRVDVAESRAQGGTGLGLAIVKHIVGHHRGRLTIESPPDGGALFRVLLPLAPEAAGLPARVI